MTMEQAVTLVADCIMTAYANGDEEFALDMCTKVLAMHQQFGFRSATDALLARLSPTFVAHYTARIRFDTGTQGAKN